MWDDRGSDVTNSTVFIARSLSEDKIHIDSNSLYISSNRIKVHKRKGEYDGRVEGDVSLETIDPRVINVTLTVAVLPCPPGMVLEKNTAQASCQCGVNFDGVVRCDLTNFRTEIQRGYWIGYYKNTTVTSRTPYFDSSSNDLFIELPRKADDLDKPLCGSIHRTGILCGDCIDGGSFHTYTRVRTL